MTTLDRNIIDQFESKLDKSANRVDISESIRAIGISKTALKSGKSNQELKSFDTEISINARILEGDSLLDEFLKEIEIISSKNGSDIQLSRSYFMFWERLERSNFLLERLIDNEFQYSQIELNKLLDTWLNQFGNWDSYCGILNKYGVVPQEKMQNTKISLKPNFLDSLINIKLKQAAALLSRMLIRKLDLKFIRAKKNKALSDIYNMLAYTLGLPINIDSAKEYLYSLNVSDIFSFTNVVNFPCENLKYEQLYTSSLANLTAEKPKSSFLNIKMEIIERLVIDQINSGDTVIVATERFDSDIDNYYDEMFDLNETMATCLDLDKGKRLNYGIANPIEISRIKGYHIENEKVTRWKLGKNGRTVTIDNIWLNEFAYKYIIKNEILVANNISKNPENIIELDNNPIGALL